MLYCFLTKMHTHKISANGILKRWEAPFNSAYIQATKHHSFQWNYNLELVHSVLSHWALCTVVTVGDCNRERTTQSLISLTTFHWHGRKRYNLLMLISCLIKLCVSHEWFRSADVVQQAVLSVRRRQWQNGRIWRLENIWQSLHTSYVIS